MTEQKELSVMLEEIEERVNFKGSHAQCAKVFPQIIEDDRRLVKALRRAIVGLDCGGPINHKIEACIAAKSDITAILNGEEEKQDSGEPGAV